MTRARPPASNPPCATPSVAPPTETAATALRNDVKSERGSRRARRAWRARNPTSASPPRPVRRPPHCSQPLARWRKQVSSSARLGSSQRTLERTRSRWIAVSERARSCAASWTTRWSRYARLPQPMNQIARGSDRTASRTTTVLRTGAMDSRTSFRFSSGISAPPDEPTTSPPYRRRGKTGVPVSLRGPNRTRPSTSRERSHRDDGVPDSVRCAGGRRGGRVRREGKDAAGVPGLPPP